MQRLRKIVLFRISLKMTKLRVSHADKTAAILTAAAEIFGRDGFAQGNVDDIAERAAVTKPTIYNRFGDKRSLFIAAMNRAMETANARILTAIHAISSHPINLREELETLGNALVACFTSTQGAAIIQIAFVEHRQFPELQGEVHRERHLDLLAGKFASLAALGYLRVGDPQQAARQYLALVTSEALVTSQFGKKILSAGQLEYSVTAGVATFLAAFGIKEPGI